MLTGPTALATSTDPVAAAKVAVDSPRPTIVSRSLAVRWATRCSTSTGSRRSPRFPLSTSCAASSWASSRRRRPRSRARSPSRVPRLLGCRGLCRQSSLIFLNFNADIIGHRPARSFQMADITKLVDDLSALTVLEAAELAKALEEKWGVSAAAAVAVAGPPPPLPGRGRADRIRRDPHRRRWQEDQRHQGSPRDHLLGLGEAKALVEGAPKPSRKASTRTKPRRSRRRSKPLAARSS